MPATYKTSIPKPFSLWRPVRWLLTMLLAIVAGHTAWNWSADRALQARIASLRDAGGRVLPSDFQTNGVEVTENGAIHLHSAAEILNDDTTERRSVDYVPTTMPVVEKAWPYLTRAVDWFEPALRRIDLAASKPRCRWDHNLTPPVLDNLRLPELNEIRSLDDLLATSALVEHHRGNDALALHRLDQMLQLGRWLEPTPSSVGHYVANSAATSVAFRIEHLAPGLKIGDGPGEADPDKVRELIDTLLDESASRDGLRMALDARQMEDLDMVQTIWQGGRRESTSWGDMFIGYMARPMLRASGLVMLDRGADAATRVLAASNSPDAQRAVESLPPMTKSYLAPYVWDPASSSKNAAERHFRAVTDRRLAATALAIRLFVVDHQGKFPASLRELVPGYLSQVPLDAMSAGNRTIGYRPGTDPILYSVGSDGNDDNASEAALPDRYGELDEWARLDRVFYLSVRPRLLLSVPYPNQSGAYLAYPSCNVAPWEPQPVFDEPSEPSVLN